MSTNPQIIERIRKDIKFFYENNDNVEMEPTIIWDTLKCYLRGKFIMEGAKMKREKEKIQKQLEGKIEKLVEEHNVRAYKNES